jgi:ABC-type nitrate/sulfonate/bicarbonate transport system substrate-binding protein
MVRKGLRRVVALLFCFLAVSVHARTPPLQALRLNTFPNATNLALYPGIANGMFERRGIRLELEFTQNSEAQRDGLATGRFEIAYSAVDNAVAMVELAKQAVIVVSGGDTSRMEFMVHPEIKTLNDRRGLHIVAGNSRQRVFPIANAVPIAREAGARIVIMNAEATQFDAIADARLNGWISEELPQLCVV